MFVYLKNILLAVLVYSSPYSYSEEYVWHLPAGFPEPKVPADNPMSEAKVELGRYLFYDTRLSINHTYSCATCHDQKHAFTDNLVLAIGATGQHHSRNSMSLTNVAYNASYTWADPKTKTLEQQIHIPLFNESPIELGMQGREAEFISQLSTDQFYKQLFVKAFSSEPDPVNIENVIRSLASFVRTIISGDSAYDHLVYLDKQGVMSESARNGMRLFFSNKLKCSECHSGFNFSGPVQYRDSKEPEIVFHDNGLHKMSDKGVFLVTKRKDDMSKFRAPTLRNIAVTAPYMHDGSLTDLDSVIEHYVGGGIDGGNKSKLIVGFEITQTEKEALKNFLQSLTDENFLSNPAFSNPFKMN